MAMAQREQQIEETAVLVHPLAVRVAMVVQVVQVL
jgi:hypothetical protein